MSRAVACVMAGAIILFVCGVIDSRSAENPLRDGFAFVGPVPDWTAAVPFVEAVVPPEPDAPLGAMFRVLLIEFEDSDWEAILADGRAPRVGEREALAGVLCDAESFEVGGETYTVTGRIRREAACFSTAFAVPYDESAADALLANARGRRGFYDQEARSRVMDDDFELSEDVEALFVHDAVPMAAGLPFALLGGLALTLYGGAVLQWAFVQWLHKKTGGYDGLVGAQRKYPVLFRYVLTLNYAAFVIVMAIGLLMPHANLAASRWVFEVFSEGDLKELGRAYIEGNIPLAAWETFRNNFIVQTFIMSTLPSLLVPLFGVGKTLLSITVVGFAMAPVWSGGAAPMIFHWVTIAVELQAYILVSFCICVYTLHVLRTFDAARKHEDGSPSPWLEFRFGFEALASATMYACLALAVGAIYEAVTLIAFGLGMAA